MTVGSRIKQLREKMGLSQVGFGNLLNVSGPSVAQWEANRTKPNHARLRDIARIGNVTTHWLLEGGEIPENAEENALNNEAFTLASSGHGAALDTNFLMECQRAVTDLCREMGIAPTWTITEVVRAVYTDAATGARTGQEMRANLEAVLRVYRRHPALLSGV
ncbi:helix-turn-helix transcriptional regulator [Azospirillum sp. HJ39]|uniref:helix-turn-helix domain-containing protein n=1 Tax=Azospirillum sp. HJ39 TaxID=3159496 RepID=UPI0035568F6A